MAAKRKKIRAARKPTLEIESASIILLGAFNPAIFQPFWFARHRLVRDEEAEDALVQLVRPEFTSHRMGPFSIQVRPEQASFEIHDIGHQKPLLDLVDGVFQILGETPIHALGINRNMHFRASKNRMDSIGHRLAPPHVWDDVLGATPEVRTIVSWGSRSGSPGRIQAKVEPSAPLGLGVYIGSNEHFVIDQKRESAAAAVALLREHYDAALDYGRRLADHVLALGEK